MSKVLVDKQGFVTHVKKKRNRNRKPATMNPLDWELLTATEQRVYTILKTAFPSGLKAEDILAALNKGHADVRDDHVVEDVWTALDDRESPLANYTYSINNLLWTLKTVV